MAARYGIHNDGGGVLVAQPVTGEDFFKNAQAYEIGKGKVRKDPQSAYQNYLKAASLHHVEACFTIATYLMQGKLHKPDMKAAMPYFREAADAGHVKAMERMVKCAMTGSGMDKDLAEAMRWAKLAQQKGSTYAEQVVGELEKQAAEEAERMAKRAAKSERARMLAQERAVIENAELEKHLAAAVSADKLASMRQSQSSGESKETAPTSSVENEAESVSADVDIASWIRAYFENNTDAAKHLSGYMAFLAQNTNGETSACYADLAQKFSTDAEGIA